MGDNLVTKRECEICKLDYYLSYSDDIQTCSEQCYDRYLELEAENRRLKEDHYDTAIDIVCEYRATKMREANFHGPMKREGGIALEGCLHADNILRVIDELKEDHEDTTQG